MNKIKLANIKELINKEHIIKKVLGKTYLIEERNNQYIVYEYMCRHQGADLSLGTLKNGVVTCPRHGWQYKRETGECIKGDGIPLKQCQAEVSEGYIFLIIELGN
ncbi:MAG TPA: Rieske (2Fe-2S) protein [Candidatus Hydrogenedens sp.]|nr:Rieske (2Fe-2S) protein [Candidatus Hydrogenedens sp.]HPP57868.1 Rieske (2Fe-2S) protein [Candidatus Hydrogenedens sp.]